MMSTTRRRKKVAIIGTRGYPSYYGGFETLLRHLVPYLVANEWDVDVYCRDGVEQISSNADYDQPGCGQVRQIFTKGFESKSASTLTYGLTSAMDAVTKRRPDVALVMNVANGFWLPVLRARGIPTIVNVDGIEWDRDKWGRLAKKAFRVGARMTAKHADELVFDAEEIRRRWDREFKRDGVFIPYGGTTAHDLPADPDYPRGSYALYVARFVPENSIEDFIEAAEKIAVSSRVVIVGSSGYGGPIEERVQAVAAANKNISWLGHVSNDDKLHALWANAGAYFHGHSVGGTNPALVQAMACGAPVIARDTPYNREVLGDAGVFARPEPADIAHQVARVLDDDGLRGRIALAARQRQSTHYTWELVCQKYEATLSGRLLSCQEAGKEQRRQVHGLTDNSAS